MGGIRSIIVIAIAAAGTWTALHHRSTTVAPARWMRAVASHADPRAHANPEGSSSGGASNGEAAGAIPDGTTVFGGDVPAVAKLDPALLRALRQAATDSQRAFMVNGGWRSPAYEDELRREAVQRYGSEEEAARWVATGTTSPHVTGDAVDVGPPATDDWLAQHGAAYGLCQIFANEPWHYELRPAAAIRGCPEMYADPTQDPRMRAR